MRDFLIEQDDAIDKLVDIGEILGASGVNIEGLCLTTCDGLHIIHFVSQHHVRTVEDLVIYCRLAPQMPA
jgi:hypothetical protein